MTANVPAAEARSALPARRSYGALLLLLMMPAVAAFGVVAVQVYLGVGVGLLPAALVAALALCIYALNGLTDAAEDQANDPDRAATLARDARTILMVSGGALLALGGFLAGRGRLHAVHGLILVAGIAYSFRMVPWYRPGVGRAWLRLKDVLLLKNLTIAATWTAAVFVVPALDARAEALHTPRFVLVATTYALLTVMNSVFCDVRDLAGDAAAGVDTLPVRWGAAGCFRAMAALALLWVGLLAAAHLVFGWIDHWHFAFLAGASVAYPGAVWIARERATLSQATIDYLVEASDPLFAAGLLALGWVSTGLGG